VLKGVFVAATEVGQQGGDVACLVTKRWKGGACKLLCKVVVISWRIVAMMCWKVLKGVFVAATEVGQQGGDVACLVTKRWKGGACKLLCKVVVISWRQVYRITPKGKRPHPQTSTPTEFSESPSPTPHQEEEENDLVNNYTLDHSPYIDQLLPIEGGESLKFKQTWGMFKCFGYFLSNLGKKK
nr:hypothetical protein [Tanacetum cinerariifolium]